MSFKFSSGRTININHKLFYHYRKKKRKKEKLYPDRLPFENFPSQMMYYRTTEKFGTIKFLPHLDPNLASRNEKEKKKKQENESEIRSISQGGEEKRGIDGGIWAKRSKRREPGFKLLRSRLQLDPRRYRLLGTPMQLHNEVVTAIAAINLAVCRRCVCMWTSDVSGKTEYGNACKSCNKSIIYICRSRRA